MFNQVYNKMWKDWQNTAIQRQGRENGSKPQQNLVKFFIWENCWLIVRAVKQWKWVSRQAQESPHPQAFKNSKIFLVWMALRVVFLEAEGWGVTERGMTFQFLPQSLGFSLPVITWRKGLCHLITLPLSPSSCSPYNTFIHNCCENDWNI